MDKIILEINGERHELIKTRAKNPCEKCSIKAWYCKTPCHKSILPCFGSKYRYRKEGAKQKINPFPNALVDLGLPSGNLWSDMNIGARIPEEFGKYYTFKEAIEQFKNNLPTRQDFEELIKYCRIKKLYTGREIRFYGKNDKYITFPLAGLYNDKIMPIISYAHKFGVYWSSSENTTDYNCIDCLAVDDTAKIDEVFLDHKLPIRTVQHNQ